MQIFTLHQDDAISVNQYNSINFHINRIAILDGKSAINFAHLHSGGIIGKHKAPVNQLLIVVSGKGTVTGNDDIEQSIQANQIAYFEAGEMHETKTESGLSAIIIENFNLKTDLLKEVLF